MSSVRYFAKLFLLVGGIGGAALFACLALVGQVYERRMLQEVESRLRGVARLLDAQVNAMPSPPLPGGLAGLQREVARWGTASQARLTLIAQDGTALADSLENPAGMGNQLNQPEIRAASALGEGRAVRPGPPQGASVLVVALRNQNLDSPVRYIRAGAPLTGLTNVRATAWRLVAGTVAATWLALSAACAWIVTRLRQQVGQLVVAIQAIGRGDFRTPITEATSGDLDALSNAVSEMRAQMAADLDRLRQSSQQLSSLLGTMSEGVVAVDNRGRILFANNAARGLLEFATPDTVGRPLLEAVRNRAVQEAFEQAFRDPEPTRREVEVGAHGRRVVSVQASRLPGEPSPGVLAVLRDVTELRRLENLRQEFVANVSHELKTPLTVIAACAETLLDGALDDAANNTAFVRRIAEQADRLHQLILDLISVARIESGQSRFEIAVVPLAPVVAGCLAQFAAKAEAKQIELAANPPTSELAVLADEEGLEQILSNLVDNAIKYTPARGRVSIAWQPRDGAVAIEVADTGIGIAPDDQPRIFERFYRVDKARSREMGGTGLGLSIVKHLTQAFGGSVSVASDVGRGSTFSVRLPRG